MSSAAPAAAVATAAAGIGTSVDRTEPDNVRSSRAPERSCDRVEVELPRM